MQHHFATWLYCFGTLLLILSSASIAQAAEGARQLKAGAAIISVTPERLPVLVNGGMTTRSADKVFDPLHARCIVLDDGAGQIAIVVVDSCMLPRELLDDAKEMANRATGIPANRMLISATHTHSAPSAMGCLGTDVDQAYASFLPARIARGIELAQKNLEPARIGWGVAKDPANVFCRRFRMKPGTAQTNPFSGKQNDEAQMNPGFNNPNVLERTGPVDDEVAVVSIQAEDGRPLALVANYSTHYAGAPALSADYFGVFAEEISKRLKAESVKPPFVGIMSNGTSGDANCIDFTRKSAREFSYHTVAKDSANAAFHAIQNIKYFDWVPIVMEESLITLKVRMPTADEVTKAKAFLETAEGKALRNVPAVYARETVLLSELPPSRELRLQAIRMGGLGITAMPNEVFGITGLTIKKASPLKPTFNIELANGAEGYIPPPDQHKLGGYTTWRARTSCLEETAEPKIRAQVLELLTKVAAARQDEMPIPATVAASAPREVPSPVSAEDSLKYFDLPQGLEMEVVAAEPMVHDPVAFDWGPDGKLWVAEMRDYPTGLDGHGKPGGAVRFLEDTDGDGRYDKSTLFLDNLPFPNGVMAYKNGVLITAAPDILFAADTTGDGKADVREVLFTGFHEANQQLRVNGLRLGLDGWIYCASGSHNSAFGAESRIKSAKTGKLVHIGSRDFRFRPDTGELEPQAGPSQFGRNRDAWGNWFGTQNARPLWHFVLDDGYTSRNPHFAPPDGRVLISDEPGQRPVFARSLPGKFHHTSQAGQFTSANSGMIYGGELLGDSYAGNSFVSEPVHNLVHRERVERSGATFRSAKPTEETGREFLASEDTWFRPTTIRTGPDGALWIADMYREIVEHPQWVNEELKPLVDRRTGHDRGRIYRIFPNGNRPPAIPRIDVLSPETLALLIDSPSTTLRDMAQLRIVSEKLIKAVPTLEKLAATSARPAARLQAMWTLNQLGQLSPELLAAGLRDKHPEVRRNSIRLCEGRLGELPSLGEPIAALVDDDDAAVRLQLACTLGTWECPWAALLLAKLALRDQGDAFIFAGVMSSLHERNIEQVLAALFTSNAEPSPPASIVAAMLATAVGEQQHLAVADTLRHIASPVRETHFAAWQLESLGSLHQVLSRHKTTLADFLHGDETARKQLIASTIKVEEYAVKQLENVDAPEPLRLAALRLCGRSPRLANDAEVAAKIAANLAPQYSQDLQSAAVQSLADAGSAETPALLLAGWKSHSPALRAQILETLLTRPAWSESFVTAIERATLMPSDIDVARRQMLLQRFSGERRKHLEKLLAAGIDADRSRVVEQYHASLPQAGDVTQGRNIFARRCATCHQLEGVGNQVGPELTGLTDKSPASLLAAILDPNRAVEPRYINYTAITSDGLSLSGMLTEETGASLTLLSPDGKRHTILRSELETLVSSGKSVMPEGLEREISPSQMADLLKYLQVALAK